MQYDIKLTKNGDVLDYNLRFVNVLWLSWKKNNMRTRV